MLINEVCKECNEQGGFRLIEIIAPKYSGTKRV